jgi:hypothetical protein
MAAMMEEEENQVRLLYIVVPSNRAILYNLFDQSNV